VGCLHFDQVCDASDSFKPLDGSLRHLLEVVRGKNAIERDHSFFGFTSEPSQSRVAAGPKNPHCGIAKALILFLLIRSVMRIF
jgi:hypothetical protein